MIANPVANFRARMFDGLPSLGANPASLLANAGTRLQKAVSSATRAMPPAPRFSAASSLPAAPKPQDRKAKAAAVWDRARAANATLSAHLDPQPAINADERIDPQTAPTATQRARAAAVWARARAANEQNKPETPKAEASKAASVWDRARAANERGY